MTAADVLSSPCWSSPRPVLTRYGARILRTMPKPTGLKATREELRSLGISIGLDKAGREQLQEWKLDTAAELRNDLSRATETTEDFPCPAGLEYLPFQKAGIAYALRTPNCLIGDEMGLGKTVQALGVLNSIEWKSCLIICPATLKLNWQREARKWLVKRRAINIINAGDTKLPGCEGITIINYDILGRFPKFLEQGWDVVIVDEAHAIKNPKAQRTKRVLALKSQRFIALSGTPMLNRPVELWTIANRCAPNAFQSWWHYTNRYCGATSNGWGRDVSGATNLDELQTKLRQHVMIRRLKKDVLTELPAKRRQIIELPPTKEMKLVMDEESRLWSMHEDTIAALTERRDRAAICDNEEEYKAAVGGLKQAWKVAFESLAIVRKQTALAKLPLCVQHIKDQLEGGVDKIVVFAHHKDVVAGLMAELKEYLPVVVAGDIATDLRQKAVDAFQNAPACRVFIGSITAAGVGITLTASSHVVFCEMDWTPAMLSQCEDRCHRIGQKDSVLVQHLVLEGSLDANMIRKLMEKQEIADLTLDRAPTPPPATSPASHPGSPAPVRKPSRFSARGAAMPITQADAIHQALKIIAGLDSDHAAARNGEGFSKFDSAIGHELAKTEHLSAGQKGYGWALARKYRRQLPEKIINLCKFDEP
jgi:SWI/SNF-related matrix-associated actin-dependent regulator 1 of chromatin subfamily A